MPYEVSDENLKYFMHRNGFGEIIKIITGYDTKGIADGTRKLLLKLKQHIPSKITLPDHMTGEEVYVHYDNRPAVYGKICYICKKSGHEASTRKNRVKCQICRNQGRPHLTKHCMYKNRQNQFKDAEKQVASILVGMQQESKNTLSEQDFPHLPRPSQQQPSTSYLPNKQTEHMETGQSEDTVPYTGEQKEQNNSGIQDVTINSEIISDTCCSEDEEQQTSEESGSTSVESLNTNLADIMILGDSQVRRIAEVSDQVQTVFMTGGRFADGKNWLKRNTDANPDHLVLFFGTNHTKDKTPQTLKNELKEIMDLAINRSKHVYAMATVPYRGMFTGAKGVGKINRAIEVEAAKHSIKVIDIPEVLLKEKMSDYFEKDKIHINKKGAELLLKNIITEVNKIEKTRRRRKRRKRQKGPKPKVDNKN